MSYSNDSDLTYVQKNIMEQRVENWQSQHDEAKLLIDRDIENKWFKNIANGEVFDPSLMLNANTQLLRLSVYKTLELAYLFLAEDFSSDNPHMLKVKEFAKRYESELMSVLNSGIDYDWDGDGAINDDERSIDIEPPRLIR